MLVGVFETSQPMLKSRQLNRGNGYMPSWPSWSIKEASEKTGYHPEYLRQLLSAGIIEGEKLGQMWLIKIESLEKYITDAQESSDGRFGAHKNK